MEIKKHSMVDEIRFNDKEKRIGIKFKEYKCFCGEIHPQGFIYYHLNDRNYEQIKEDLIKK